MKKNVSAMAILETILASLLIVIVCGGALVVPFLGIAIYFSVIPLVLIGRRRGVVYSAMALAFAYAAASFLVGGMMAVFILLIPGIPAVLMGMIMGQNQVPKEVLKWGMLSSMLVGVVGLGLIKIQAGVPVEDLARKMMQQQMSQLTQVAGVAGTSVEMVNNMMEAMIISIPAILIIWSIISVSLNYYISVSLLRRIGAPAIEPGPFRFFRLPRNFIIGALLIYIVGMLIGYLGVIDQEVIMSNLFLLYQFIFCVQGLAVILFALNFFRVHIAIEAVIVVFLFISGFGTLMMFLLGLVDIIVDIRTRMMNKSNRDDGNPRLR